MTKLLEELEAPPRLIAHLTLVHDVAVELVGKLEKGFPALKFDRESVLLGAAIHDIGKAKRPAELTGKGAEHEIIGRDILIGAGFSDRVARFAWTHGGLRREPNPTLEDLLVQQADGIWKGARNKQLEASLVEQICEQTGEPQWKAFSELDNVLTELAEDANERLAWQSIHEV
ncbi:MAG: HD domain-containing protein [Candidatus Obscuribacterales bacterium]